MLNNTLLNVTNMVKAMLGYSLTPGVGVAADQQLYQLIAQKQQFLADKFDFQFLERRFFVTATVGTRYLTMPTINKQRPMRVSVLFGVIWIDLFYGIGTAEYNVYSSGDGGVPVQPVQPIQRWDWYQSDQLEVWPIPPIEQQLMFVAQSPLTILNPGGVFDPTLTVDLDDHLVSLQVAAEQAMVMKRANAGQLKIDADLQLNYIRSNNPARMQQIPIGQSYLRHDKKLSSLILVAGPSSN